MDETTETTEGAEETEVVEETEAAEETEEKYDGGEIPRVDPPVEPDAPDSELAEGHVTPDELVTPDESA